MDEGLNPSENEDPGRDWTDFRHPNEKNGYRDLYEIHGAGLYLLS
jgi:hypothetical protein